MAKPKNLPADTKDQAYLPMMQEIFCQEYIKDLNQQAAALRAGYGRGKNAKAASVQASRMLKLPEIRARIQELMDERASRTGVTPDSILMELLLLAKSDISQAFDSNGALIPLNKMPKAVRRAVASVKVNELFEGYGAEREHIGYTKEVKFWDKTKALELLGKHLKLFADKLEVEHKVTLESLIAGSIGPKDVPNEVYGTSPQLESLQVEDTDDTRPVEP